MEGLPLFVYTLLQDTLLHRIPFYGICACVLYHIKFWQRFRITGWVQRSQDYRVLRRPSNGNNIVFWRYFHYITYTINHIWKQGKVIIFQLYKSHSPIVTDFLTSSFDDKNNSGRSENHTCLIIRVNVLINNSFYEMSHCS